MPIEITMPRLSDTMEEGTVVKWRVDVGDAVSSGDHLADVETDKATMELPSFDDGTVAKILIGEGQAVPVGQTILILAEEGESVDQAAGDAALAPSAAPASLQGAPVPAPVKLEPRVATATGNARKVRISPVARKLAEASGLDLTKISGSGPGGRIIKRDILAAEDVLQPVTPGTGPTPAPIASAAAGTPSRRIALSSMRKTIARRLVESKTTIPHFQVEVSVSMDPLLDLRKMLNSQFESEGVKFSVNDFMTLAAAMSCVQHPAANSSWAQDHIVEHAAVNIGIAVALAPESGGGLVVPVLRDVANMGLRRISAETRSLVTKARTAGLTPDEMAGGTFTISNLGMYGVGSFTAIINPPQAAILALGGAAPKPVIRQGQIVIGQEMSATLSADHRVLDGVGAAEFLNTFRQLLENPATLLI